jgi:hypothetical protein
MVRLQGHRTAELRSLAYHRRVAEKLRGDRDLLARARANVDAAIHEAGSESGAAYYALGWRRRIDGALADLLEFLISDSQEARDFRQASPFAGALNARERWQLWREAAGPLTGSNE